jgi:hypothetical protein
VYLYIIEPRSTKWRDIGRGVGVLRPGLLWPLTPVGSHHNAHDFTHFAERIRHIAIGIT